MALRTTVTAIREVIETGLDDVQIRAFAADADAWVTEELVPYGTLSSTRLELVTRYLACALIRIRDLGLTEQTLGDAEEVYQVDPKVSEYLKMAASFDSTGRVFKVFIKQASMRVIARVGGFFTDVSGETI